MPDQGTDVPAQCSHTSHHFSDQLAQMVGHTV